MDASRREFGRYLIRRQIGRGGMAEVYEAQMCAGQQAQKRVALKVLRADLRDDQRLTESFIDEARMAAGLTHPNVVEVFDFGEVDGELFIAMEYLDGLDLRQLMELCRRRGEVLPLAAAVFVVHELALALDYIHTREAPIIHRDVTPHNLFVTRQGHVKLGDFGVAKSALRLVESQSGEIKGKLGYLAPEQLCGDPVTARTDVYAAGLVLFELLTGQRLLRGNSDVEVIRLAMEPPETLPSSLNPEAAPLDRLVRSALQRHPAMRLASAALLARRLQQQLARAPFDAAELAQLAKQARTPQGDQQQTAIFAGPYGAATGDDAGREQTSSTVTTPFALHHETIEDAPPAAPTRQLADQPHQAPASPKRRWPLVAGLVLLLVASGAAAVVLWVARLAGPRAPAQPQTRAVVQRPAAGPPELQPREVDAAAAASPAPVPTPVVADRARSAVHDAAVQVVLRKRRRPKKRRPRAPAGSTRPRQPAPGRPHLPPVAASVSDTGAAARQRLQKLLRSAASRGLFPGDSATMDRKLAAARRALGSAAAAAALEALEQEVAGFRIDRRFAERKLARLERAIGKAGLDPDRRQQLEAGARRILKLVMASRLVEASQLISRQMRVIQ